MKEVNILSLVQAYKSLDENTRKRYFDFFQTNPRPQELEGLTFLVNRLITIDDNIELYNYFYHNYKIPQISREFDLLRFGDNYTVNIELKSTSTVDKIKNQLIRNRYYLSFLGMEIYNYTYVSGENKLYSIDSSNDLFEARFKDLVDLLNNQEIKIITNIDKLFNPSNYLVSPFNSSEKFIWGEYFLTNQQEEVKKKVIDLLYGNESSFISICGKAGTGKTLLTYDVVKQTIKNKLDVLIIHCGKLNSGHYFLMKKFKWDIIAAKSTYGIDFTKYDLIVVDEVQRIYPTQLDHIIDQTKAKNKNCIFSYDAQQCLRKWEINNNISNQIIEKADPVTFELTEKIRTNKEIASFINSLFDRNRSPKKVKISNVELNYFNCYEDAYRYMVFLSSKDWKIINYTPSKKYKLPYEAFSIPFQDNAHDVVGQEYDKVIAVLDSYFYYDDDAKLSTRNYSHQPFYHPTKMLFQIMTRTRRKLSVIIIDNNEVMERCLTILGSNNQ